MKKILLLGVMACVAASSTFGQTLMNLRQCMEYALQHSAKSEVQRADFDDALLHRREAILQAFTPTVSAGINAYSNFGRTIDPETNSYISSTSFSNGYSVNAGITLFDGLSAIYKMRMAKNAVHMGHSEEQQLKDEICLSVMQCYYKVVFQSEMQQVLKAQVQTARDNLNLMRRKLDTGQKGYADVVQVEADLAEREYQLVCAENEKNEAMLNLKALMFWPVNDTLSIDTSVVEQEVLHEPLSCAEHREALTGWARQTQPAALIAKGKLDNARYALRTARGRFLPTLSLSGGWSTNFYTYPGRGGYDAPGFSSQFRNNGGEYVQLSLTFPLYDRLSRQTDLKRKKNEVRRAESAYRQTLHEIDAEVRRALQDRKGAAASLLQADKRLAFQEESYRLNTRKFAEGLISPVEFQTLSNAYLNAKAERINARLQYNLKQSVVRFYQGESYLEQQKAK